MRRFGLIFIICLLTQVRAETFSPGLFHKPMADWLKGDSLNRSRNAVFDTVFTDKPLKNPLRPMTLSLLIPGLGQLDNGKKWKALGFFVVETTMLSYIVYLNRKGDSRRSDFTWYWAFVHTLDVMDAVVDAYLYGFDEMLPEGKK